MFESINANVTGPNEVTVGWTVNPQLQPLDVNISVWTKLLGNGDCYNNLSSPSSQIATSALHSAQIVISKLFSWSRYNITIKGKDLNNFYVEEMFSEVVTLEDSAPVGPVTQLSVERILSRGAVIIWQPPECQNRKGNLTHYELHLSNDSSNSNTGITFNTNETRFTSTDLLPKTKYTLQVAYSNQIGHGPNTNITFTTLDIAQSVVEISNVTSTYSTITMTLEPSTLNLGITSYMVTYSRSVQFDQVMTDRVLAVDESIIVGNLLPDTWYYLKVAAVSGDIVGPYGSVYQKKTLQLINITLISSTRNCLLLNWITPPDVATYITSYNLTVTSLAKNQSLNYDLDPTIYFKPVCDLQPTTPYYVTILGTNKNQVVSMARANFSTATLVLPTLPKPVFIRSTRTTITVAIEPLVSTDISVTSYQLVVKQQNSNQPDTLQRYITAEFTATTFITKTQFVIGDGQHYGNYTNKVLTPNTYYVIDYVALFNFFNKTTTQTSQMDLPIYTEPFDSELATTINLTAVFRNTTCLNISWFIPRNLTNTVTGLKLGYTNVDRKLPEITLDMDAMMRHQFICGLSPTTTYVVSLTVMTTNGVLIRITRNCSTVQLNPPYPYSPVLVNSSYTNITLIISPVQLYDTSPSTTVEYFLIENEVSAPSVSSKAVATHAIPGNITARLFTRHLPDNVYFVVGNGRNYGGYDNVPLQPQSYYVIYYGVCTTFANYTKCSYSAPIGPVHTVPKVFRISSAGGNDKDDHSAGIIVGCIFTFLVICLVILLLLFIRRRIGAIAVFTYIRQARRNNPHMVYKYENGAIQSDRVIIPAADYNIEQLWNSTQDYHEGRYITFSMSALPSINNDNQNLIDNREFGSKMLSFADEFHYLKSKKDGVTQDVGRQYPHLNRFPHLLPYDHSLVRLRPDVSGGSEYINASFIPGYKKIPGYIAAQSPFNETTVLDFWRLIYQRCIKTIVLMSNLQEKGVLKCLQYWPTSSTDRCGHFNLQVTQITEYTQYTRIHVQFNTDEDTNLRTVQIFQMTSWPESGVPGDPLPLLEMRDQIQHHHGDDRSPILVHCGTGVGRTGVFIAVDTLIKQYETEGSVQVCDFISRMRRDRPYMVRTFSEYVFIYDALFQHFVCGSTSLKTTDIDEKLSFWLGINAATGKSYLQDQFTLLQRFTRRNLKNRDRVNGIKFLYKLTDNSDLTLVCQSEDESESSDSIGNPKISQDHSSMKPVIKVQTDGVEHSLIPYEVITGHLKTENHFIVDQFKANKLSDVIRLIWDANISSVICLSDNPLFRGQGNMNLGQRFTLQVRDETREHFTVSDVNIICTETNPVISKRVRVFQKIIPPNEQSLFVMAASLAAGVIDWQKGNRIDSSNVIVLGSLNNLRPDLFAIILIICKSMTDRQEVDVYRTIKDYNRRYSIINDHNDYKFCYMVLKSFIDFQNDSTI
ncbi:hypothetical protein Btru_051290 [Bulinus truncatus]|nr:hypothetical protein Btru_051290 [Bulinus truncatus]